MLIWNCSQFQNLYDFGMIWKRNFTKICTAISEFPIWIKSICTNRGQPHNAYFLKGLSPRNTQPSWILTIIDGKGCIGLKRPNSKLLNDPNNFKNSSVTTYMSKQSFEQKLRGCEFGWNCSVPKLRNAHG